MPLEPSSHFYYMTRDAVTSNQCSWIYWVWKCCFEIVNTCYMLMPGLIMQIDVLQINFTLSIFCNDNPFHPLSAHHRWDVGNMQIHCQFEWFWRQWAGGSLVVIKGTVRSPKHLSWAQQNLEGTKFQGWYQAQSEYPCGGAKLTLPQFMQMYAHNQLNGPTFCWFNFEKQPLDGDG